MSLFSDMEVVDSGDSVAFNTGTRYDLATGIFQPGVDGEWYLNGGLSAHINAFVAPNGNFKSTIANSLIMRATGIYNNSETMINDTENSLDKNKERAVNMAEELAGNISTENILWMKGIDYDLDTWDEFIKSYCTKKEAAQKDYMVETPFIDPVTLKPLKVWIPTFVFCDSISELVSSGEEELIDGAKSKGIGDSKANTVYMLDGNKKTLFIRTMRRRCQKYGLIFVCTGHYDKTIQMDMYNPNPKETLFAKQDWKLKGCGSKMKFLSSIYARMAASVLVDSNKESLYADGLTPAKDIHEVDIVLERCKTANAGEMFPFVCSQSKGLLNAVSDYHYLRLNEYYGLEGNKQRQQVALLPDVTISRNTVRELATAKPQLRRALEICAGLCYIKNNWNCAQYPYDFNITPSKLFEKLTADKNKTLVDEILNSRGYWTYGKCDIPYMSLFTIMEKAKALK